MRRHLVVSLAVCTFVSVANVPADTLDQELRNAREQISRRNFPDAVSILEAAIPRIDSLPADVQPQARTAMHFYAAVAYSGLEREDEATFHLQEAFRISPNMRAIDSSKFDARFVALFQRARAGNAARDSFEKLYPGFAEAQAPDHDRPSVWSTSAALEILGSKAEKRRWQEAISPAERERFIADFWRLRDPSPHTGENEFRKTFERRVAFADTMFGSPGNSGALTDRGHVFALLGQPAMVRRRALSSRDAITVMNYGSRGIDVGTVEYWFYTRDQLPSRLAKPNLTFRFVSHQGVGQHVLQKDGLIMNALAMASTPAERE